MTFSDLLKRPSAYLPLVMSGGALGLVLGFVASVGVVEQSDEGTAARIFQLLLVAQLPVIGTFAMRWLPRAPRPAMLVLGLHLLAAVTAVATVIMLEA